MSLPSIVSYGAAAKTSSLVWDGDLVIPDGFAIESASGEVGISGDVSISGSVSAGGSVSADDTVSGDTEVSTQLLTASNITLAGHQLSVITQAVPSKAIVVGDNNLTLVSSQGAKITGTLTFKTNNVGTTEYTLTFTATDALGTTKNIETYNGSRYGIGTWPVDVDVAVPVGTTKIKVAWDSEYGSIQSSNMNMSAYITSLVC